MDITKNIAVSAIDMSMKLREGALCPVELIEDTLFNIKSSDPAIFTVLLEERALREAHASRQRWRAGKQLSLWDGIPIAWKDLFDIEGRVTTAGSIALKDNPPAVQDAEIVVNATQAGLVSVGCLNMTEFAYSGLGLNPHFGTPINSNGTGSDRIPGGSSSGCGVAVARGLVPLAIGSDTGGSIRIPAALNGVVGYKGSSTAFSKKGVFHLSPSLDTLGPLAADVESCIGATQILNKRNIAIPKPKPINTLNILIPENVVFEDIQDAVLRNFESSVCALENAGARITRCKFSEFDEILKLSAEHGYLTGPEVLDLHWDLIHSKSATQMDQRVLKRILEAKKMSARDLFVIQRTRAKLIEENRRALNDQIVLFPTVPIVAPELKPLEQDNDLFVRTNKLMLRNTSLGNFLDWCGIALPNGIDKNKMPTSLLLSMSDGNENKLFEAAISIEKLLAQNL